MLDLNDISVANPTPTFASTGELPVTIMVGDRGNRLIFDADPTDGTINIQSDDGTNITFDLEEFAILTELLCRTADGGCAECR